jgi:hypothetical protein
MSQIQPKGKGSLLAKHQSLKLKSTTNQITASRPSKSPKRAPLPPPQIISKPKSPVLHYYQLENCYLCTLMPLASNIPVPNSQNIPENGQTSREVLETFDSSKSIDQKSCAKGTQIGETHGVAFFGTGELYVGGLLVSPQGVISLHGKGCLISSIGCTVVGEFRKGRLNGAGIIKMGNGDLAIAEWKLGYKHGRAISFNRETGRKVKAFYEDGEVKAVDGLGGENWKGRTDVTKQDVHKLFPEVNLTLESIISSSPLFAMNKTVSEDGLFIGTSDKRLGLRIIGTSYDIGFFRDGKPHGHNKRCELTGSFVDGVFMDGILMGPAVCFLSDAQIWTFGQYRDYEIIETKVVNTEMPVPPLAALSPITFPQWEKEPSVSMTKKSLIGNLSMLSYKDRETSCGSRTSSQSRHATPTSKRPSSVAKSTTETSSKLLHPFEPLPKLIIPFINISPFYFSEVEADYITSAVSVVSLPFDIHCEGIEMIIGKPDQAVMEIIEEKEESETERDANTSNHDRFHSK